MSLALDRLKVLTTKISSYERVRKENLQQLEVLFNQLDLSDKVGGFHDIFEFKAINLSGISLNESDIGTIKEGKYLQMIGIKYDKNAKVKNRNISLAYYGRVEKVEESTKNSVVQFVIAWRFEKSFRTLEHYYIILDKLPKAEDSVAYIS